MRIRVLALLVCLLGALPAAAQDTPAVEVFGGYQYSRVNPGEGIEGLNLNGWNAAVAANLNDWFGIVADFSGGYGSNRFVFPGFATFTVDTDVHSFLFGPQFSYRRNERVVPFARALFGAVRASASLKDVEFDEGFLPGTQIDFNGTSFSVSESETGFGMALGGGLDVRVSDRISIRAVQADYVLTRFGVFGETFTQHNARISAGVVFRFGVRE